MFVPLQHFHVFNNEYNAYIQYISDIGMVNITTMYFRKDLLFVMSVTRWVRAENNAQTSGNYFVWSIYVGSCRIIFSMVMYNTAMFNASVKSIVEEPILVFFFHAWYEYALRVCCTCLLHGLFC